MIHAVVGAAVRTPNRLFARAAYPAVAFLFGLVAPVSEAEAASRSATLEAIHQLENPRNSTKPGRHGELGAYQFRLATWRMHTSLPFRQALNREVADAVAIKHYEWIKRGLESAGLPATPYYIALAWNCGLEATIRGRAPAVARDYAQRASNLARAIHREQLQLIASLERRSESPVGVGAQ